MNEVVPAVILSHGSGGLGTVPSHARRGIKVPALLLEQCDTVRYSRYADTVIDVWGADDLQRDARMLDALRNLDCREAAMLTTSDVGVSFLSRNRNELRARYRFARPRADSQNHGNSAFDAVQANEWTLFRRRRYQAGHRGGAPVFTRYLARREASNWRVVPGRRRGAPESPLTTVSI